MSYSAKELYAILHANPELTLVDDGTRTVIGTVAPKLSEFDMQAKVFELCTERAATNDDWLMVVAIPNGQYRPGQRMEPGTRKGFPDLIAPVARHSRIGLALELKVTPNKPTEDQLWWHRQLRLRNWAVDVIYDDPQKVIDHIEWYLEK